MVMYNFTKKVWAGGLIEKKTPSFNNVHVLSKHASCK